MSHIRKILKWGLTMKGTKEYTLWLEGVVVHVMDVSCRRFEQAVPAHSHGEDAYEFHYVVEGSGFVVLQGATYEVGAGILYVTGPGIVHEQMPEKKGFLTEFGIYIQIPAPVSGGGEVLHTLLKTPCWLGYGRTEVSAIVTALLREMEEKKLGFEEKITHLLAEFLIACTRSYRQQMPACTEKRISDGRQLPKVKQMDSQLLLDEIFLYEYRNITLENLAKRLGFSVRQTQRWIKKVYGKSFQEKKLEARMSAAAMLLVSSNMRITELSEQLGYSSIEHFSGAFTKYFGMSPRRYRKQKSEIEKQEDGGMCK